MQTYTIEYRRNAYIFKNYAEGLFNSLEKSLMVYDIHEKRYTHKGYVFDEENMELRIPSTVSLDQILTRLVNDGYVNVEIDNKFEEKITPHRIENIKTLSTPRNNFQVEAIKFLVAEDANDKKQSFRLLSLDTGFGKTICTILAICKLKMSSLIFSVNLSEQWIERIIGSTTANMNKDVVLFKTWKDMDNWYNSDHYIKPTFFVMGIDAAIAMMKRDPDAIRNFCNKFGIGIQVFDECHEHFMKIIKIMVRNDVERTFFLSATPTRADKSQEYLYRKLFRVDTPIYGEQTHSLNKFNIIMHKWKSNPNLYWNKKIETKRGVNQVNFCRYMSENKYCMRIALDTIVYFSHKIFEANKFDPNKKVLVYFQSCKGIKTMKEMLEDMDWGGFVPTIGDYTNNITNKYEKEQQLKKNIIFTTIGKRAGFDIDGLIMVINFIPTSSDSTVRQMRGRIRDKFGWFVDCTDYGFMSMIGQRSKRLISHKKNGNKFFHYEHNGKEIKRLGV
jgi:superfamily II DNA or RNA helicase